MYILGIVEGHCSSAALLRDGEIVAVCFEERLSRLKNDMGYPERAIEYCLSSEGIVAEDIDYVAMVTENLPFGQVAVKREATFGVAEHLREQEDYWKPTLIEGRDVNYLEVFKDLLQLESLPYDLSNLKLDRSAFKEFQCIRKDTILKKLKKTQEQVFCIHHHLAHSLYAVYTHPKYNEKDWLVLAADGYGDDCSSSVGIYSNNTFKFVAKSVGSGIGRIYRYVTLLLAMRPGVDEFKVMGLAPYAKEYHWRKVHNELTNYLKVNGMKIDYINPDKDLYFSLKERLKASRFDGIAGGLQAFCEDITREWVKNCIRETGIANVACSGGVAMNIKINKVLHELDEVEDLYVGPSGGDESLSLGAAYALWHQLKPQNPVKPLSHPYLGPEYGKDKVKEAISLGLPDGIEVVEDPSIDFVAQKLADGKIIARSIGRMEYGARALGNRSILARADSPETIRKINDQIKRRDFWMPFAPIILSERMEDYLVNPKKVYCPHMTLGFESTPLARKHIKAALHPADDTCRPQILSQTDNPALYELLKAFEGKTGIGGLLNTSFNLHGEPICCDPKDSLKTFINSELDGLYMDGYILLRG